MERLTLIASLCSATLKAHTAPKVAPSDVELLADLRGARGQTDLHNRLLAALSAQAGGRTIAFAPVRANKLGRVLTNQGQTTGPSSTVAKRIRSIMRKALCNTSSVAKCDGGPLTDPWVALAVPDLADANRVVGVVAVAKARDAEGCLNDLLPTASRGLAIAPRSVSPTRRMAAGGASRSVVTSILGAGILAIALAFVPVPNRTVAPGAIASDVTREVTAPFDGRLKALSVEVDDTLVAGQTVLAQLATDDIELKIASTEPKMRRARAEADLARREGRPADLHIAQLNADAYAADLALLQDQLRRARLTAPIDGLVVGLDAEHREGSTVARGERLMQISTATVDRVVVQVPDRRISDLQVGQTGYFRPVGRPFETLPIQVLTINPIGVGSPSGTQFEVTATVIGLDTMSTTGLRPGMEGEAVLISGDTSLGEYLFRDLAGYLVENFWI